MEKLRAKNHTKNCEKCGVLTCTRMGIAVPHVCTNVVAIPNELERLQTQNHLLQEQNLGLIDEIADLRAENAKLQIIKQVLAL